VSNRAYLHVWCREFSAETIPSLLRKFLETVPFSRVKPGISRIVLRAVDRAEIPLLERDLRAAPAGAAEVLAELGEQLSADCGVELEARWDLWVFDAATGAWNQQPQPLDLVCNGPEFDGAVWQDAGHLFVDLGFEHLFTGHARLLGAPDATPAAPQHPAEAEFLERMARQEALREYTLRTRENIHRLNEWIRRIGETLQVERFLLLSEGEEDFEERLDAILEAG
jgi:hypothetical protein